MNCATAAVTRSQVLISFSGIDGAGKTTQIDKLYQRLSQAGLCVTTFTFWDNVVPLGRLRAAFSKKFLKSEGGIGSPAKPVRRNDKNVRAWYLDLARSALYLMDTLRLRYAVAKARKCGADVIVFDRYIYDQLAALPNGRMMTRACVRMALGLAPAPDVAYLLDADPEAACERKPEYPLDFLWEYRLNYLKLRRCAGMALIPPLTADEAHDAIMQKFEAVTGLDVT